MAARRTLGALPIVAASAASLAGLVGLAAWARAVPASAIRRAFEAWADGSGSIYDLMDADAEIVILGSVAHCGTWRKDTFLRDVASPFVARFSEPPVPHLRSLWASLAGVAVRADATGTTRDGGSYANDYIFLFEMRGQRVTKVTEFLDMAAFNAVGDTVEPELSHVG